MTIRFEDPTKIRTDSIKFASCPLFKKKKDGPTVLMRQYVKEVIPRARVGWTKDGEPLTTREASVLNERLVAVNELFQALIKEEPSYRLHRSSPITKRRSSTSASTRSSLTQSASSSTSA